MAPSRRNRNRNSPANKPAPSLDQQTKQVIRQETRTQISQAFSGPIPPPEILGGYNDLIPGAAERIFAMAEKQAEHRRGIERDAVSEEIRSNRFGQWGAVFVSTLGIAAGVFTIYQGSVLAGGLISGGTISAIAVAYITGTLSRASERKAKTEMMTGRDSPD